MNFYQLCLHVVIRGSWNKEEFTNIFMKDFNIPPGVTSIQFQSGLGQLNVDVNPLCWDADNNRYNGIGHLNLIEYTQEDVEEAFENFGWELKV